MRRGYEEHRHSLAWICPVFVCWAVALAGWLAPVVPAIAQEVGPEMPTNIWAVSRGGQLYDAWWAVIEADEPH
jgi:hypothetical protein